MYKQIRKQKPVLQKYAELLISQGVVNQPEYEVPSVGPERKTAGGISRENYLWFRPGCKPYEGPTWAYRSHVLVLVT